MNLIAPGGTTPPTTDGSAPGRLRGALRTSALHLLLSVLLIGGLVLALLTLWFPGPSRELAGGSHLFWLILLVDVACGPLLTAIVYNPRKPARELFTDLSLVVAVQIAFLAFGLHTLALARPVVMAFEVDRFVIASAADIDPEQLKDAPPALRRLSWRGPVTVCTRMARDSEERWDSVQQSLAGTPPAMRPGWWQPFDDECRDRIRQRMRLLEAQPGSGTNRHYLPLTRGFETGAWSVLLEADGTIAGYAPIDGFATMSDIETTD